MDTTTTSFSAKDSFRDGVRDQQPRRAKNLYDYRLYSARRVRTLQATMDWLSYGACPSYLSVRDY